MRCLTLNIPGWEKEAQMGGLFTVWLLELAKGVCRTGILVDSHQMVSQ